MRRLVLAFIVLASVLAGCSSDGGGDSAGRSTSSTRARSGDEQAPADYCRARLGVELTPDADVGTDADTAQQAEALKAYATRLQPEMERVQDTAPDEVSEEVGLVVAAVDAAAEAGTVEALQGTAEVQEARQTLHAYDLEHCGWGQEDVEAQDYAFDGVSESLEAGPVSFELSNEGNEYHELAVIRKQDGTTESFAEILAMEDEEQQQAKAQFFGGIPAVAPGAGAYVVVDLTPGEYLIACFLSVGSTPEKFEAGPVEGAPHLSKGMQRQLDVSSA